MLTEIFMQQKMSRVGSNLLPADQQAAAVVNASGNVSAGGSASISRKYKWRRRFNNRQSFCYTSIEGEMLLVKVFFNCRATDMRFGTNSGNDAGNTPFPV
jgi:hypothetical protein